MPVAAALVGFAFLLMELVWYRMLGPLLGGSSYTFGLILAVALLGIGARRAALRRRASGRAGRRSLAFAATCALEALLIALPFALGDRVAVLAALLRPLGRRRLPGPGGRLDGGDRAGRAAGGGRRRLPVPAADRPARLRPAAGRPRGGGAYAANTLGAILGSIAGGFGLIPLLTAPGVWRLVALLLLALAAVAVVGRPARRSARAGRRCCRSRPASLGLLCCLATGPTAFWRHTPDRRRPGADGGLERAERRPQRRSRPCASASSGRRTASRAASRSTCRTSTPSSSTASRTAAPSPTRPPR